MLLPTTLLFTLCSTLLFYSSASAQTNQTYQPQCLRFPRSVVGNATINPDAITALSKAISDNNYNPPLPSDGVTLKPGSAKPIQWSGSGGFQVCVQNWWFFKTITVPLSDLSGAVSAMASTCCDNSRNPAPDSGSGRVGLCQDSSILVPGTGGSEVKVVSQDFNDNCCGLWGCYK